MLEAESLAQLHRVDLQRLADRSKRKHTVCAIVEEPALRLDCATVALHARRTRRVAISALRALTVFGEKVCGAP
jgi:hypothetical protein